MRILLGIVLGAGLTIGGAYLYDSNRDVSATNSSPEIHRSLVNWDVVNAKWQHLTTRARAEWNRLAG